MTNQPQSTSSESKAQDSVNRGGRLLKEARLAQGMSLEVVQEATKIPLDALKAIEEGYKIRSLSPFYLRGFMKMYAKYLGLDLDVILAEVPKAAEPEFDLIDAREDGKESSAETSPAEDVPSSSLGQTMGKFFNPDLIKTLLIGLLVLVLLFVAFRVIVAGAKAVGGFVHSLSVNAEKKSANKSKTSQRKDKAKPKSESKKEEPAAKNQEAKAEDKDVKAATETSSAKTQVTLTVRASKDSWFQVKADGKTVFQSTMRAGRSESWTAKESLDISGKNINQLEYEVNGKFIGALGRKDRQAKRLVITKDGMSVTQ